MNTKKNGLIAASIGLLSALAFTAHAQQSANELHTDAPAFEELDKDENGGITAEEAQGTWLESSFAQVDVNSDGYVTKTEYEEAIS